MGGGGRTSSTSNTTNNNTSGTSAISGDNLGVVLSGISGSEVNVTSTDHGAIEGASAIANHALDSNVSAINSALDFGRESQAASNSTAQLAITEATEVSTEAMENMLSNSENTTAAIKSMAAQSGESARAALTMAENTISQSQIGSDGEMSKVAIAVAVVLGVGFVAVTLKGGR